MIREKVKALWRLCFDDSEEFIEMYFRLRYNNDVNIAIKSGEEVISALQMIPYSMTYCEEEVSIAYISGACTHPDFRSNGVMRELLSQAFARMYRNGKMFSVLIPAEPWLFDYYARIGYAPVFCFSEKRINIADLNTAKEEIIVEETTDFIDDVYMYIDKKMKQRDCCIQHSAADFKVVLSDLALTHDAVFIARDVTKKIVGVAVVYQKGESLYINEIFADNDNVKTDLLQQIGRMRGICELVIFCPVDGTLPSQHLGMIRVIDAKSALQLYAAANPRLEENIELVDEQLTVNNGYYYLCKGKCMFCSERLPGSHVRLTIGELAKRLFASYHPYMSLMMD